MRGAQPGSRVCWLSMASAACRLPSSSNRSAWIVSGPAALDFAWMNFGNERTSPGTTGRAAGRSSPSSWRLALPGSPSPPATGCPSGRERASAMKTATAAPSSASGNKNRPTRAERGAARFTRGAYTRHRLEAPAVARRALPAPSLIEDYNQGPPDRSLKMLSPITYTQSTR